MKLNQTFEKKDDALNSLVAKKSGKWYLQNGKFKVRGTPYTILTLDLNYSPKKKPKYINDQPDLDHITETKIIQESKEDGQEWAGANEGETKFLILVKEKSGLWRYAGAFTGKYDFKEHRRVYTRSPEIIDLPLKME
jgi:hypothetical protein